MSKILGGAVMVLGVAGLGIWGANSHAERMENQIRDAAQKVAQDTVHDTLLQVNGRDITISGLADDAKEKEQLLAQLNDVPGRRVVVDNLEVLPVAEPYKFSVSETNGKKHVQGHVPTEAVRAHLAQAGLSGVEDLQLAKGAPRDWENAVAEGLHSLEAMDEGVLTFTGENLHLAGVVNTPADRATVLAALNAPDNYSISDDIKTRDDGMPVKYAIAYDATEGASLSGKLPKGLTAAQLSKALGVPVREGETRFGLTADGAPFGLEALERLNGWLAEFERADITLHPDKIMVNAQTAPSVDSALVQSTMAKEFAGGAEISVTTLAVLPKDGAERAHVATGQTERFENGYWIPVADFDPSALNCSTQTQNRLSAAKINFLSGSADLGPRAVRAINGLASVVRRCVLQGGLIANLGGHTDNTGTGHQALSTARASAVRVALIARGVPADAITATGFGASQPIADNATAQGRAANRRTTIEWTR